MNRNSDLPKRMHYKHGRYYYVHRNKWTPLAKEYHLALQEYARLIKPASSEFSGLCNRARTHFLESVKGSTFKTYEIALERIERAFTEFLPSEVKPKHVYAFLNHYRQTPAMANTMRNVLKSVMQTAVKEGLADSNPVRDVEPFQTKKRDRYLTDSEYQAIRENASNTLKLIMDMLYLTGQRIGDVLKIKHSDITSEGIFFQQQKTGTKLMVAMSPDLERTIKAAKELHYCVRGITLFHTRQGKPFAYWTVRTLWKRATEAAKIENANIHDIRAKTGTDARRGGLDSMKLLGHKTETSHNRYLRGKEIPLAEPVTLRQSKKNA